MWPPHFTPTSPPLNGQSRSTSVSSTAPRHPSNLGPNANGNPRPQFSPRSSSLNVSAKFNASNASLNSPRYSGAGSALRQELVPPSDARDPLKVLEEIVGEALFSQDNSHLVKGRPESLIDEIDFESLTLDEFAAGSEDGVAGEVEEGQVRLQTVEECEYVSLT